MKKIMLVGKTGCGKTTLTQVLLGLEVAYRKTQAVCYSDYIIDTPGEFAENRRFYSALLASSSDCDIVGLVQDGTAPNSIFPPKFSSMFSKRVIGIVSKAEHENCNLDRSKKFLHWAGVEEVIVTSSINQLGIDKLQNILLS